MKLFTQSIIFSLLFANSSNLFAASKHKTPPSIEQKSSSETSNPSPPTGKIGYDMYQRWLETQHKDQLRYNEQQANFLALENLLKRAVQSGKISDETLRLATGLINKLQGYPLQTEAKAQLIDSQYKTLDWQNLAMLNQLDQQIVAFVAENPEAVQTARLQQYRFKLLGEQQKFAELANFATQVNPKGIDTQAYLLKLDFQQASQKLYPQVTDAHSLEKWASTDIMQRSEKLWLENTNIPDDAVAVISEWGNLGRKTHALIEQKMQNLFAKNDNNGLEKLQVEIDNAELKSDIEWLQKLLNSPTELPALANHPEFGKDAEGKLKPTFQTAIDQTFVRFLKTLPEQFPNPDFSIYQQWAENWQLSEEQQREWKIAFLNRFFDSNYAKFQEWRDQQILQLKADKLTERRLRLAIWQQTDLNTWLAVLSPESQQKQEWRYWQGKADRTKTFQIDTALSKERGFYPMLAAARSKLPYKVEFPKPAVAEQIPIQTRPPALGEIAELRQLERFGTARSRWRALLEGQSFERQLQLSQYAMEQHWWDLAVDGTIVAKAWDYLSLRLPPAYADYFAINLQGKSISQSFAMAIARQESAFNPAAQSSANARGLMQLLPSTAKLTAENNQLVYASDNDLFKPFNNIMLGTAHLGELNQKYPNNRILIAAAYNAGAKNVEKWLARANGKLAMDEFIASIPYYETRGYVQNVVAYDYYYQILQRTENQPMPQIFSQAEYDRLY